MKQRQAGVLLHITSLPNDPPDIGTTGIDGTVNGQLNHHAWLFVDWLEKAKIGLWQLLPLTHTHNDGSPYHALSAFAMDPKFLPQDWMHEVDYDSYQEFEHQHQGWLPDYALFMVLREQYNQQAWYQWPEPYKFRDKQALENFSHQYEARIDKIKRQQFALFQLWQQLKVYANHKGVSLFGDMPLFVALDSADVWANPRLFKLDELAQPQVVAGVPPDYFSETGQRWGNPHYDWQYMQDTNFTWWHLRLKHSLRQFDWLRIDHFRGLQACWEIAADEPTAINGRWVETPGQELLESLLADFDELPLIAEDLGLITPEVLALKKQFDLPGMAVMQFGFDGLPDNPHALGQQQANTVIYSGTHDNDTSLGWWQSLPEGDQQWIGDLLQPLAEPLLTECDLPNAMPWWLIVAVLQSRAQKAVIPMQDLLMLDSQARMNTPGTIENNWLWQFDWAQVDVRLAHQLAMLMQKTQRVED